MEPTIEKIEVDVTLSPSEGETLEEYTDCLSEALADLVYDDTFADTLASGRSIIIEIEGMPKCATEPKAITPKEDDPTFSLDEFLDARLKAFAADNPELLAEFGLAIMREHILEFITQLTADDKPTETAKEICKAMGVDLPKKKK